MINDKSYSSSHTISPSGLRDVAGLTRLLSGAFVFMKMTMMMIMMIIIYICEDDEDEIVDWEADYGYADEDEALKENLS